MSETANGEANKTEAEKPVSEKSVFPPFPAPKDADFDDDISEEEKKYYLETFPDINKVATMRLHCTACDRHLGSSARFETRMRSHPMLRTLMCNTCHSFYNSGEFDKGEDGSELYCRWCGQGGQVYCCSDCPIVFCAKCIKRNLGAPKIKEIENTDDWKCFKCNSECLWFLRATCWALLRYCDLKNKIAYATQEPSLRNAYIKECNQDLTECCKSKLKRKLSEVKKKESDTSNKKSATPSPAPKLPPSIQVKKFASINNEEQGKDTKKTIKRPVSPKTKILIKSPITVSPAAKIITPVNIGPPPLKKVKLPGTTLINPIKITNIQNTRPQTIGYSRIRPKPPHQPPILINSQFNGFNSAGFGNRGMFTNANNFMYNNEAPVNDNINLSLENLTQGLDMNVGAMGMATTSNADVVCTPDFPLEPLCEVTEETDDDVQCITPVPAVQPRPNNGPPPLLTKYSLSDMSSDNIIQMTENDVTVNQVTGGLKFRVDPQTLSSNKMYRLPDGRIFAINANPNMPGGYSATIVAVTDNVSGKITPKTGTYAAKLSAVSSPKILNSNTSLTKANKNNESKNITSNSKRRTLQCSSATKEKESELKNDPNRQCDLKVPIEWYRYNLIDAIDALEYSLSRLQNLKKEATTMFLRTRTVAEMRGLHKRFDRLLNTSACRFTEIKSHLNKEMKQYLQKKMNAVSNNISDDDDDVEILNDSADNDDPIFIDENSLDGTSNDATAHDSQQVDLTHMSEHNDSGEKSEDHSNHSHKDPLDFCESNVEESITSDVNTAQESDIPETITSDLETAKKTDSENKINENDKKTGNEGNSHQTENDDDKNIPNEENAHQSENEDDKNTSNEEIAHQTQENDHEKSSFERSGGEKDKNNEDNPNIKEEDDDENKCNNTDMNSDSEKKLVKDNGEIKDDEKQELSEDKSANIENEEKNQHLNESKSRDADDDENEDIEMSEDKSQDVEMSDELIETLLLEDSVPGDFENVQSTKSDVTEDFQESNL